MLNIPTRKSGKKGKFKRNLTIYFGHENYNLILNMMIGIRISLKKIDDVINSIPNGIPNEEFGAKYVVDLISTKNHK